MKRSLLLIALAFVLAAGTSHTAMAKPKPKCTKKKTSCDNKKKKLCKKHLENDCKRDHDKRKGKCHQVGRTEKNQCNKKPNASKCRSAAKKKARACIKASISKEKACKKAAKASCQKKYCHTKCVRYK